MNRNGPIIIIEDDKEDQELFTEVFVELNYMNEVIFFTEGEQALEYLTTTDVEPFLILSDIYMPKLTGMDLREKIHENEDLRLKCIPFLFYSTLAEQKSVIDAYSKSVQGFFIKGRSYKEIKQSIEIIVSYWQACVSPNYVK
jgi:CheY-like chemotaxis protein